MGLDLQGTGSRHSMAWLEDFRRAIADIPEIVEAYRLTGEPIICSAWWCQA
ncbi:Lrp/AsnC ligand binding domain-containing protein [Bradyrhizobium sp. CCBAU 51627]|uniref:Lrp/AsnC ligand binding domain-containing protein n=1 Tax=Bradyrhizobium sp. CCBAU 51627 TaxID=1325088 RepID=UPI0023058586|nr:Lrp/AsnC ligand binding domain-containing protein [Bradyrhizobium sp. CCBAU 51627]